MTQNDPSETPELIGLSIDQYLTRLASKAPAPGGGSAAALVGAQAAALTRMVAGLTIGRKRYAGVQQEMIHLDQTAIGLQKCLTNLVDEDAQAFARVSAAFHLPQETEIERVKRQDAIQTALRGAVATPLATAEACLWVLRLAGQAARLGNPNATGDANMASWLAHAALMGAANNAQINLAAIRDQAFRREVLIRLEALVAECKSIMEEMATAVRGQEIIIPCKSRGL